LRTGIMADTYTPGLYFVGPGTTMHTFPREIHVLEASYDRQAASRKAANETVRKRVDDYFDRRDQVLGGATHRTIEALNVQTSDGYAVTAGVAPLYTLPDPGEGGPGV